MPGKRCVMSDNVFLSGTAHALSTDKEEIIGFLLGTAVGNDTYVLDTSVAPRIDKKSDRVEVSADATLQAMADADKLSTLLQIDINVVGWYHSHPRITCPPSHVDIGTQHSQQRGGKTFVGIIFSAFSETQADTLPHVGGGKLYTDRVQCHCFQALSETRGESVPVVVEPVTKMLAAVGSRALPDTTKYVPSLYSGLIRLLQVMQDEEETAYKSQSVKAASAADHTHLAAIYCKASSKITSCCGHPLQVQLEVEPMSVRAQNAAEHLAMEEEIASKDRDIEAFKKLIAFQKGLTIAPVAR